MIQSMTFLKSLLLLLTSIVILSACVLESPAPAAVPTVIGLPPGVVLAAQQWLGQELGAAPDQVNILAIDRKRWPDGCLGLGRPGEMCTQAIIPGWQVIFAVDGQQYEVRTNETGSTIRLVNK